METVVKKILLAVIMCLISESVSESQYQYTAEWSDWCSSPDRAAVSVCRRCLSGLADGAVGRILCATLQFLPHTREF